MAYFVNNLALVDKETGEVIKDRVYFFGNEPTEKDTGFTKIFIAFLEDMLKDKEVMGKAIRLLLYAVHKADWNSLEVYLFYKTVCKDLKVSKKTYFKWLKVLMDKKYIEATDNKYVYRLKPYSFVKGSMAKVKDNDWEIK